MNSPDSASTAVISNRRSGHSRTGSRLSMTARRAASGTVSAASAMAPMRARARWASRVPTVAQPQRSSVYQATRAAISEPGSASCAVYSCAGSSPAASSAPTTEPAEVPTTASAPVRSTPSATNPAPTQYHRAARHARNSTFRRGLDSRRCARKTNRTVLLEESLTIPSCGSGDMRRRTGLVATFGATTLVVAAGTFIVSTVASAAAESRPFPFHVTYQVGVLPSASAAARDAAVRKQYDSWKATYLVHGCASNEYYVSTKGDGDAPNDGTVSEAQGYGMNIVPLMAGYDTNAKTEFDGLWQLVKNHRDGQGMMQWQLDGQTCRYADSGTPDGATDGDLDIGYGLVLADKQWGGYTADALGWLGKFYAANVTSDGHLNCLDDAATTESRPSDWMLDHLRAFAAYDAAHDWNKVITKTQNLIQEFTAEYSPSANLLSDFIVSANTTAPNPAPANYQENQPDNIVGYNSLRVPWHMGTDALLYGNPVSLAVARHESASYKNHSGGDPK